jgi:hypothetical protein
LEEGRRLDERTEAKLRDALSDCDTVLELATQSQDWEEQEAYEDLARANHAIAEKLMVVLNMHLRADNDSP